MSLNIHELFPKKPKYPSASGQLGRSGKLPHDNAACLGHFDLEMVRLYHI
jgi:hypothetical protein